MKKSFTPYSKPALLAKIALLCVVGATGAGADEQLFGYVKGAESLPAGAWEVYQSVTRRADKGLGHYEAFDARTEVEAGVTDRFSPSLALKLQSLELSGLRVDGYLPEDRDNGLQPSGAELAAKYMFLSPALHALGFSTYASISYDWIDPHSGQDKDTLSAEVELMVQKYLLDGRLIWVGNGGLESTYAHRSEIDGLPEGFEWPTEPEMELEIKSGTGLSYRFARGFFLGAEVLYETEFETEVGQERWSVFAGPSLHYGGERWWATLTWLPQLEGGGERYEGQPDTSLHLIEKTETETRLKVGLNF